MKRTEKTWKEWKQRTKSERKWTTMKEKQKHTHTCIYLSLGFRDRGTTCILFFIENMFLEIILFHLFFFIPLLCYFFWQNMQKKQVIETHFFKINQKENEIARAARVFLVRCARNNMRLSARGQRCQNKVSFDRPQPGQIK